MRGHFLLRPHVCLVPNHYSAPNALKIALSLDNTSNLSYRKPHSKRTSSSRASKETGSAVAGTALDAYRITNRASVIRPVNSDITGLPPFSKASKETGSAVAGKALHGAGTTPRRPMFHSRPNHDANVYVRDLRATLDAHRITNRASVIRPVNSDITCSPSVQRPKITYLSLKNRKPQLPTDATNSACLEAPKIVPVGSEDLGPQAIAGVKLQKQHGNVPQEKTKVRQHRPLTQFLKGATQTDADSGSHPGERFGNYRGLSLWLAEPWSLGSSGCIERPWLDYHQDESGDGYSRLRAEILAFHAFISPTPDESAAYKGIIDDLQDQAYRVLPNNPLEVIGSQRTALATSLSDLDFRLSLPEYEKPVNERGPSTTSPEARRASNRQLQTLIRGLSATNDYENIQLIWGRIPIVSGVHRATGLTIQIQALTDSSASREYVLNYLTEFPTLYPLYTLIKTTLEIRNLRNVRVGGLGAYSTFMLVVAALKESEGAIPRNDIARQLLSALDFYSGIDLCRHGISVDPPGLFHKVHVKEPAKSRKGSTLADPILRAQAQIARVHVNQPYLLCMQDPANPLNDLGAKAYNIRHVQALFRVVRRKLWALFRKFDHLPPSKDKSHRWAQAAMLDPLVGASYGWFQSRRARIAEWGRLRSRNGRRTPSVEE